MDRVRVLIADDQLIARSGLKSLLASLPGTGSGARTGTRADTEIEVVGEASSGGEVVSLAAELEPDVILMDLRMPVLSGVEATRRIHRAQPHIGILVVTMFEDDTSVFPAIRAGARGYLLKDADQHELLRAVVTVASGGVIFSAGIAERVLRYLTVPPPELPQHALGELTGRERSILELLACGYSNVEIAERLGLSPKTVSNNVSNVLFKVQATDRAKLMLMALEAGLGTPKDPH